MKFKFGLLACKPEALISPSELVGMDMEKFAVRGMLLGVLPALFVYMVCRLFLSNSELLFWLDEPIWIFLSIFLVTAISHELTHVLFSPDMGFADNTVLGIDDTVYMPYVLVAGPMSKVASAVHFLAPLLVLTPALLLVGFFSSGIMQGYWAVAAIVNAAGAGADLFLAVKLCTSLRKTDYYQAGYFGQLKQD